MNERAQRVVLFILISVLLGLQWTSHGTSSSKTAMAFVHYSTGGVMVRIDGDVAKKGIHKFYDGETLMTAIKMTAPDVVPAASEKDILQEKLPHAVVITVRNDQADGASFVVKPMNINDLMLLCIPLDPDLLTLSEWEALPGIGRSLGWAIINNRQTNGAFGSVTALERVPGVGKGILNKIIKHF